MVATVVDAGVFVAERFVAPPTWPRPPEGWVPPPGWQPDPVWGPAPQGWQFWVTDGVDRGSALAVPPTQAVGPPTEISGEDGRIALVGDHLLLTYTDKFMTNALKSTIGVRAYPRQKVSGVYLGKTGTEFTHFLALGVAICQNGAPAVATECQQIADAHRATRP